MKKSTPPAPTPRGSVWRVVAVVSLAANVALVVYLLRARSSGNHPDAVAPKNEVPAVVVAKPNSTIPRELRSYAALGSFMAENNRISDLGWSEPQFSAFLNGFRSSYEGKGIPLDDDAKALQSTISERVQRMLATERPSPIDEYFRTLREKEGVSKTSTGLHYRVTEAGTGPHPKPTDAVIVSFAARLPDGQALPALTRARTRTVVRDLLPGLAEGIQLLSVGGKALVYLPPELAFSEENWPPQLPKNVPLAFFVELHEIEPPSQ